MTGAIKDRPRIIELVGPAGAGKTTLAHALARRCSGAEIKSPPYFRDLDEFPFFGWNAIRFLPVLTRMMLDPQRRNPSPRQVIWMLTLQGWHHRLARAGSGKVTLLDQGAVFIMTDLCRMRCINLNDRLVKNWWMRMVSDWAFALDAVILLDAPNRSLVDRIRAREKWHLMKNRPEADLTAFLEDYRVWFERVVAQLTVKNHALQVIQLNTASGNVEEMAGRIILELGLPELEDQLHFAASSSQTVQVV